jgi:chemotaxis response regulator CheB
LLRRGQRITKSYEIGGETLFIIMNRIFIISHNSLFRYGLESLLNEENDLDIVGQAKDVELAIKEISRLKPNVVILDCETPLSNIAKITQTLSANSGIKIIEVSLTDNKLYLHQTARQIVNDVVDLVTAVTAGLPKYKRAAKGRKPTSKRYNTLAMEC